MSIFHEFIFLHKMVKIEKILLQLTKFCIERKLNI
jgi:hypothetical protein